MRPAFLVRASFASVLALCAWVSPASAQIVQAITAPAFTREHGFRPTQEKPFWVNRDDCLAEDILYFELKVLLPTDDNLEVWVGDADCQSKTQRSGRDGECWQVYQEPAPDDSFRIDISVLDVVARRPEVGYRANGTLAHCDVEWSSSLGIHFMYVDDTDDVVGTPAIWKETGVDLKGPNPPTNVIAGIGDEMLVAKWTASNSIDLLGYRIYCAPRQDVALSDAAMLLDGGALLGDAAAPVTPAPAPMEPVALFDAGVLAEGGLDAGADVIECSAPGLIEGELPGPELELCGELSSTTSSQGLARGLENGVEYAIAVSAVDDLGNPGRLSNVACGIPEPVDEFYEVYRRLGGGGGGGICSLGRGRANGSGGAWLGGALVGALALVVRRRQR